MAGIVEGAGPAGVLDGRNQIVAVTTTWYNRFTGEAVESDAQYNAAYAWSMTGAPDTMDVANVATHELGHALGLDHPKGRASGASRCMRTRTTARRRSGRLGAGTR